MWRGGLPPTLGPLVLAPCTVGPPETRYEQHIESLYVYANQLLSMICEAHQICSLAAAVDYWQSFPLCIPLPDSPHGPLDDINRLHQHLPLGSLDLGGHCGDFGGQEPRHPREHTPTRAELVGQGLYSPLLQACRTPTAINMMILSTILYIKGEKIPNNEHYHNYNSSIRASGVVPDRQE